MSFWSAVDLVWGSVDLISRRISSRDLVRKVGLDSGGMRRRDLIRSSRERWKRESIRDGPPLTVAIWVVVDGGASGGEWWSCGGGIGGEDGTTFLIGFLVAFYVILYSVLDSIGPFYFFIFPLDGITVVS